MVLWRVIIAGLLLFHVSGAVSANHDWDVPYWGKVILGNTWTVMDGKPKTLGNSLPQFWEEDRFFGGKYVVLSRKAASDFVFAHAGIVSMDSCFVVPKQVQSSDFRLREREIPLPKDPTVRKAALSKKQTVRKEDTKKVAMHDSIWVVDRPKNASVRMEKAVTYWTERLYSMAGVTDSFSGFTKKKIAGHDVYTAFWKQHKRESGVLFSETYYAWIFDSGITSYMLYVAIDESHDDVGKELKSVIEKSKKK